MPTYDPPSAELRHVEGPATLLTLPFYIQAMQPHQPTDVRAAAARGLVQLFHAELMKAEGDPHAVDPQLRLAWRQLALSAPLVIFRALDSCNKRGRPKNDARDLLIACMVQEAINADTGPEHTKPGRAYQKVYLQIRRESGLTTRRIADIYRDIKNRTPRELRASLGARESR